MDNRPREAALSALLEIRQCRLAFKKAIERHDAELDTRDRALCLELVAGVLRHRGSIDLVLSRFLKRPLDSSPPLVQEALRLGVFQLLFTEKIPPHAVLNETVNLVKLFLKGRYTGLVNGVLRNVSRQAEVVRFVDPRRARAGELPGVLSHPPWLVERWTVRLGQEQTIRLCEANNQVPDTVLRVRTRIMAVPEFLCALRAAGAGAEELPLVPGAVRLSSDSSLLQIPQNLWSCFQVQDTAAQMIAPLLEARTHERILDACAAPGGKTTHLADLLEDRSEIIAMDRDSLRLNLLRESLQRLGLTSVSVRDGDFLEGQNHGLFDRILLDAPCSGLGVVRRNPDIKWCRRPADLDRNREIQIRMLRRAETLLKPGGRVVYAVCSMEPEETVDVIEQVTKDTALRLCDVSRNSGERPFFWTWPHLDGTDGFFAAALEKP